MQPLEPASALRATSEITSMRRPLAILTYHSISESGSPITIDPSRFRAQIDSLRRAGIRGMSLCDALENDGDGPIVAITFDDGFADFASEAWPILKAAGFGATVFLVTGRLDRDNDWPGQPNWAPRLPLLSAGQVSRLAREGVEFGSHSASHRRLASLPPEQVKEELFLSRAAVEAVTDEPCQSFAYPYGEVTVRVREGVAKQYQAAVTTELRLANRADDLFCLPRVDAYYLSPPSLAGAIYSRKVHYYLAVRRIGRTARQAMGRT